MISTRNFPLAGSACLGDFPTMFRNTKYPKYQVPPHTVPFKIEPGYLGTGTGSLGAGSEAEWPSPWKWRSGCWARQLACRTSP